jgi:peroxiredoxin
MSSDSSATDLLAKTCTSTGESLAALSEQSPVLLVMLRHEGCPFCRNAMYDIARQRDRIEKVGTHIVLGHMGSAEEFTAFATRYGLAALPAVADPQRTLYRGMGLRRGSLLRLFGPKVLWAYLKSMVSGHRPGKIKGDSFQMPGAFLLHHGQVIRGHAYRDAGDRPDYVSLATP